ncbi:uncharacterized protein F4822DRAFT_261310 [Hypoxylon trugodes]|uniref:uncharacterized protein n=1 Tax=Hypoxylon trugodes TaxID=326681 RepID=UPI0021A1B1F6|nr:uncharacterized protein F4822DRAFT_261310 [Hypoxylon trugodes]KAI1388883.1 hypothetical protein F4822DRAFT_261310 [Hypoxylon trugodes]
MMSCACRTTSLKLFIQSLTGLRLSDSAIAPTRRRIQLPYPRALDFPSPTVFPRSYSATAALRFPQEAVKESDSYSSTAGENQEDPQQEPSNDATVDKHGVEALDASADKIEQAKREGTILDYSPESIDALVADLNESPAKTLTPRSKHVKSEAGHDAKSPPIESKRLKRLKIVKESPKTETETFPAHKREEWQIQKSALKQKFPEGWAPRKRLSPDALDGIRALHSQFPEDYTTEVLAEKFEVSPEAIRRILRSKWTPSSEEEERRQKRWFNRGKNIWSQMAALGKKPPRRWRREGIVRDPSWNRPRGPRTQPPRRPRDFE